MNAFTRRVWFGLVMAWSLARHFRKPLLIALVIGVGCYLAGPAVASTVSGLAGFAGSLIVNTLSRLRSMLVGDELPEWGVGSRP
ncbi:MAG TPA: hypothetical protein VKA46_03015 [Gemmataceae bacterium]|nr:hypothetical protein [Gemmataceae bacterium]